MRSSPLRGAGTTGTGMKQRTPSPVILSGRLSLPDSPAPPNGLPLSNEDSLAHTGDYAAGTTSILGSSSTDPSPGYLLPLLISRISEGLIYSVIFPYINQMVHSFGIREKDVGVWSAMAESALMVCEAFTAPLYAPLADRLGRRPVLLVCLLFWGVFAVCFGLVQSVWATIVMRGTLGLLAGAGVITRTMCGELCDKTNRIQGFAVFSPSITIGVTLGPLVGGFLANPVPRLLPPSWSLFERYPYLLPAIVSGSTGITAFISGLFLTPETLPPSMRREQGHWDAEKGSRAGLRGLLSFRPYQNVLILYGQTVAAAANPDSTVNNAVMFSWEAVFPLFAFTRKELGGLELSVSQDITNSPVNGARWADGPSPSDSDDRSGPGVVGGAVYSHDCFGFSDASQRVARVVVSQIVTGDFAATMLDAMVLDSIPGPEHLALANSLTFSVAAVGRAIGPFIISWFFSLSTSFSSPWSPGRQLVWIVFILLCLPSIYLAYRMEADRPPSQGTDDEEDNEERHELIERRSGSVEGEQEFEYEH
ncbi:hypothetical protein EHS25_006819 [Saitozyma podzolica]|uniref:Major facilitator superfamily (MFS) profile domain-containing protein n=1 Tax=Saitozyma podzolica TaxID=1890683 RepID=A0A427XRC5_9TREE|nr:hypothetical protein EHS25_006819 [Saitozyma podzolica]